MRRLTHYVPVLLGLGIFGCATSAPSSFEQAVGEVDDSWAALTAGDPEATFGAMDEIAPESTTDEIASDDDAGDGGVDESAADGDHQSGKGTERQGNRGRRGDRPRGRGHGVGLLVWYADVDALKVCRDLHATCPTSADPAACREEVKACVRPVLEQAFKAMCDEQVAACDANGKSEQSCEHIRKVCGGDLSDQSADRGAGEEDSNKGIDESADSEGDGEHASERRDGQKADESADASKGEQDHAKADDARDGSDSEHENEPETDESSDAPSNG